MEVIQPKRIQTSVLNGLEKKVLVWLANKQPNWVNSDTMTAIGFFGSLIIATGYILSNVNINFLWLASLGFIINWYGDSLDGTLARVRNKQRPIFGFYLDHTMDCFCETIICLGIGLTSMMHLSIALLILVAYLMLTINVMINTYLKKEFKLTFAKVGPTEFRIIVILINTILVLFEPVRNFSVTIALFGSVISLQSLDIIGLFLFIVLITMLLTTFINDTKNYATIDPRK